MACSSSSASSARCLLPATATVPALVEDLERTEDAEVHASGGAAGQIRTYTRHEALASRRRRAVTALLPRRRRRVTASGQIDATDQRPGEPPAGRPRQEAIMAQTVPQQHPAVVLRSHYVHLRVLLAVAIIALVA